MIAALLVAFLAATQPTGEQLTQDIQRSHIEANVPGPGEFEKLLKRDLASYFAQARKKKNLPVEFELLRDGPTQSGVSYPKFYAWVRIAGGKSPEDRGAVRLAAIEKKRFEVTVSCSSNSQRDLRSYPSNRWRSQEALAVRSAYH